MAARITIATDPARVIDGAVRAGHRWLFKRTAEEGQPLLALHPRTDNDDYRRVTFVAEATGEAVIIVVDQPLPHLERLA
jgi:hypothetical protein